MDIYDPVTNAVRSTGAEKVAAWFLDNDYDGRCFCVCQANALRALIGAEQDRGPDFLRLANALSALYPKESEEKRLLDAMLLAAPR
jgi:hypothetical protein